jgi:hypothetical protein
MYFMLSRNGHVLALPPSSSPPPPPLAEPTSPQTDPKLRVADMVEFVDLNAQFLVNAGRKATKLIVE